jgi:hypothetical protein
LPPHAPADNFPAFVEYPQRPEGAAGRGDGPVFHFTHFPERSLMPSVLDPVRARVARESLEHMLATVAATPLEVDPFPHLSMLRFFPEATYRRILELLPGDQFFERSQHEKNRGYDGNINRSRMSMKNARLERLPDELRSFWFGIRDALGSPELKRAVFTKLAKGLAFRYGISESEAKDVEAYPRPELFREVSGFRIAPHPDTRSKVVTMQISLAADELQSHLGTGFYRPSFSPKAWFREPRGFEVAKRMPFSPNAAYAFVVLNTLTKRSWHGRETLAGNSGVRNSILHIYYGDRHDANPDIVAEQYSPAAEKRSAA